MTAAFQRGSDLEYQRLEKGLAERLPGVDLREYMKVAEVSRHEELSDNSECTCKHELEKEIFYVRDYTGTVDPSGIEIPLGSKCIDTFGVEGRRIKLLKQMRDGQEPWRFTEARLERAVDCDFFSWRLFENGPTLTLNNQTAPISSYVVRKLLERDVFRDRYGDPARLELRYDVCGQWRLKTRNTLTDLRWFLLAAAFNEGFPEEGCVITHRALRGRWRRPDESELIDLSF